MPFQKKDQKIKKSHIITLALVFVACVILRLWQFHYDTSYVELKGEELHVLIAKTPKQWHKGLGDRKNLGEYDGMLFLFPFSEKHGFVMRDMEFPLDIIWLSAGTVIDIAPNVPAKPQDRPYYPRLESNAVLELPAGWVTAHNLKIGDTLAPVKK